MTPETRYARAGDAHVAYQVLGDGPIDIVLVDQWFSHMDGQWDVTPAAEFRRRLASFSRLIMFDKRGIGLSDPVPISQLPTIEEWIEDLRTVLDAVGSERAALVANLGGGLMSIVCAATYPDRITSLIVTDGYARIRQAPDYPAGEPDEAPADGADGASRKSRPSTAAGSWSSSSPRAWLATPGSSTPSPDTSGSRPARGLPWR